MERFNNWMSYSFDNGPINGAKPSFNSIFKLHFKEGTTYKKMSYYDALYYNTRIMKDNFAEPFDVLLSGGIDSEVVVRLFKEEGVRQNVFTIRLENDLNIRDVTSAINICNELNIKLNIIDWNLKKFIEHDAYDMFSKTFSPMIDRMVRHAWFELFDNIPVMGEGEPYWRRELGADHTKKSDWKLYWVEDYFTASIYANTINRPIISEWYNYTPEIVMNYPELPIVKKLLNDEIPGKQSCWSIRTEIHHHLWPTIGAKPKLAGYEGQENMPGTRPDFLQDFHTKYVDGVSNQGYKFSKEELLEIFSPE